jgi:hypothetical protein
MVSTMKNSQHWRDCDPDAEEFRGIAPMRLAEMIREEPANRTFQKRLAFVFGEMHGWRLSPSPFGLVTLARGKTHSGRRGVDEGRGWWSGTIARAFDHAQWYRRDRKAAAITAHLYEVSSEEQAYCRSVAAAYDLSFDMPDFPSWWNPGATTLVMYTARS